MARIAAVVLAAGMGTRMKSSLPKVMHRVAGRPMVSHLLATLDGMGVEKNVVVVGPDMEIVTQTVAPVPTVVQEKRLGTADAVKPARAFLDGFDGSVLILYGDTPLITESTLNAMLAEREKGNTVVVLGFYPADPGRYGRLIVDKAGGLREIVEYKDATEEQRAVRLCNSGVMCVDGKKLFSLLDRIGNDNAAREYYLTDLVALARADGDKVSLVEGSEEEMTGANSRADLALLEKIAQGRLRRRFLADGVTMTDPDTVYFSFDTRLGRDVVIEPNVFFGCGVTVEDGVTIRAFSHLEGAYVRKNAQIGPFARLRPEADIGENCHIGDFVEIKKSRIETGAKVNHLSYIGDARVGERTNIGAGTITCNYDGYFKHKTDIGADVFIGSDTVMVAPVAIGDGAMTAAGSVITKNVDANALALGRAKQSDLSGWAKTYRDSKKAEKAAKK